MHIKYSCGILLIKLNNPNEVAINRLSINLQFILIMLLEAYQNRTQSHMVTHSEYFVYVWLKCKVKQVNFAWRICWKLENVFERLICIQWGYVSKHLKIFFIEMLLFRFIRESVYRCILVKPVFKSAMLAGNFIAWWVNWFMVLQSSMIKLE